MIELIFPQAILIIVTLTENIKFSFSKKRNLLGV